MVKYVGQPLGGVAAESLEIAKDAISLIKVSYEQKPFVIDIEAAMEIDAPIVFDVPITQQEDGGDVGETHDGSKGEGNVRGPSTSSFFGGPRGDLEVGFKEADVIGRKNISNPSAYAYAIGDPWCRGGLECRPYDGLCIYTKY